MRKQECSTLSYKLEERWVLKLATLVSVSLYAMRQGLLRRVHPRNVDNKSSDTAKKVWQFNKVRSLFLVRILFPPDNPELKPFGAFCTKLSACQLASCDINEEWLKMSNNFVVKDCAVFHDNIRAVIKNNMNYNEYDFRFDFINIFISVLLY